VTALNFSTKRLACGWLHTSSILKTLSNMGYLYFLPLNLILCW
jgi:hypothetical protein